MLRTSSGALLASSLLVLVLGPGPSASAFGAPSGGDESSGRESVVEERGDAPPSIALPRPRDLPVPQILDPERTLPGSVSFGFTHAGALRDGVTLPLEGPHHFVLSVHRTRDTNHGSRALVALLLEAAERTAGVHGDVRVGVGNLSAPGGGRFRWSRSHQNGRDADIAFILTDQRGRVVEPNTLVHVHADGRVRSDPSLRFDVARNWTLVASLLEAEHGDRVQWIFVHAALREALLAHAERVGAPVELRERAAQVLHQPGDSAPHDDHFHLRLFCDPRDALEGCVNWGPVRPWAPLMEEARTLRVERLLDAVVTGPRGHAAEALDFIERLHPRRQSPRIASRLAGLPTSTQVRLIRLVEDLDYAAAGRPLLDALLRGELREREARQAAVRAIGGIVAGEAADELAAWAFGDGGRTASTRMTVAAALRRIPPDESTPLLVGALSSAEDEEEVRALSAVLARATGREPPDGEEKVAWWASWCERACTATREEWLQDAFREEGIVGDGTDWPSREAALALIGALSDPRDALAWNADRVLGQWLEVWSPVDGWSATRRRAWWSRHLDDRWPEGSR